MDVFFPRHCPVCDRLLPMGKGVHPACALKWKRITGPTCLRCGKTLSGADKDEELCEDCKKRRHGFDRGIAVFPYRSVSSSIYRFKYEGRQEYASYFGQEIALHCAAFFGQVHPDALIPVPMYEKKRRSRGYNQAALLAREVSRRSGNLKNAFFLRESVVELKCVVIIDDIYTTGSTMDALATLLKANGVHRVYAVSLSIGTL